MFFKRFRRFVRAKARRQRAARERQREYERKRAEADIEYQQRMEREMSDGGYMTIESAFVWTGVHATPEQIIAVRGALFAQGWTPPQPLEDAA